MSADSLQRTPLPNQTDSLQREPNIVSLPPLPTDKWPAYMARHPRTDEVRALEDFFQRSVQSAYFQSHPYDQMFTGFDAKVDEITLNNNYMRLIFGGKPDPTKDNIDLAYNHALRQIAESPVDKDSLLENMNPLAFVPGEEATKDSLLDTFAKQRQFFKGKVDSDTERFLKTRPTHKLIANTYYGKRITQSGTSERYNHVRGQNDLLYRPTDLQDFHPVENLSSKTYAPDGDGGEVPLNYDNVHGLDPRVVPIDGQALPLPYDFIQDAGSYPGNEIDRYDTRDMEQGSIAYLFHQYKPRM